jgi:RNA polymerase sigma factor (sigma-70 family)
MAAGALNGFLDRLTRGMAAEARAGQTDRELVERLRAGPDPATFEALVRRHGPMVYRVCRRVLRHEQDAEDAFQATFLLLARNLRSIRNPAAVASWLHGVAVRTSRRSRAGAAARHRVERQATPTSPPDDRPWGELRAVLDEELARLPERWRLPLVLCHLEGRTQDEAARQLGWPRITLRRRLDEARAALGRRLVRRGFGPAAVAAGLLADCLAAGAVPPRLIDSVSAFGTLAPSARAAVVPAHVADLAERVRRSMTTPFHLKAFGAALAACMVLAGGWIGAGGGTADRAVAQDKAAAPARKDQPARTSTKRATPDLTGDWRLALPAKFEYDVRLTALPDDRYRFETRAGLVFIGVYEWKGGRLVMAEPADAAQTGFAWAHQADGRLRLVQNSDAGSGDYLGATLTWAGTGPAPKPPVARRGLAARPPAAVPVPRCRVTGRLESTEYRKMGGTLDRAIVTVLRGSTGLNRFVDPDTRKEAHSNSPRGTFAFELPPGDYRVQCTGVGSRGATFLPTYKTFTVQAGAKTLDVGAIDLPASKVTRLFGQPAPELLGVAAWKNTDTLTLKSLRGQVVVIDFWSYACSICHHHKPDLIRLAERYKGKGLVVLTMHDNSVSSIEEMDREMESVVKNAWRGKPLGLPIGLDGKGADSVFQAFGVFAVPTVLLIDADGKVVRRFAHAGAPDLEAEVAKLLKRK